MLNDPIPIPIKGTSLFRGHTITRKSRRFDKDGDQWRSYAYGWKWAIDVLLEDVKTGFHPADHYYPIFYVFRHYLEIKLKELILNLHCYLHQEEKQIRGHNIDTLWIECKSLLIEFSKSVETNSEDFQGEEDFEDSNILEGFLKEISALDPNSESFRYPFDKKGKMCIEGDKVGPIDMNHFSDMATWVSDYLEGILFWLEEIQNPSDDSRPDYGDDYYLDD
jgi:hypothetical protein